MNYSSIFKTIQNKKCLVPVVFLIYFLISINIYKDYGMSTDESRERVTGTYALLYSINAVAEKLHAESVTKKIQKEMNPDFFLNYKDNVYGTALQIPVLLIEVALYGIKKEPTKEIWELRHLLTFFYFYVSAICFYFLIKNIFVRRSTALTATLILILTPRFFAESFYNIKDIAFLSSCIIAMFFYVKFLKDKSVKNGVFLGIFAAFSTGIRFLGIQFIMMSVFFIFLEFIRRKSVDKKELKSVATAVLLYFLLVIFLYPASWHNPLDFFKMLFSKMSAYPWEGYQLFMGGWMSDKSIPWYFVPVWMLITTPVLYIMLFSHGMYIAVKKLLPKKNIMDFSPDYQVLLTVCIMLFIPLLGVIVKSSTLYNGWRQMYFLYLPFLIIVSYSVNSIITALEQRKKTFIAYLVFGIYFCYIAVWMIVNHPYQYVFFNAIPGNIEVNYEKDYWAVSMVDGMKFVLNDSSAEKITVKRSRGTAKHSRNMLDSGIRNRIEVLPDDADSDKFDYYFFNGDSYSMKDYAGNNHLPEVFNIKVFNSIYTQHFKIMSVYKKEK